MASYTVLAAIEMSIYTSSNPGWKTSGKDSPEKEYAPSQYQKMLFGS